MSLISSKTYCFHCASGTWPGARWTAEGDGVYSCIITCPTCGASKHQSQYGPYVDCRYYKPDGTPIKWTNERGGQ